MMMCRSLIAVFSALVCLCSCNTAPPPQTAQYFFPHGHNGPLLISGNTVIRAASWTRGDGLAFFEMKDLRSVDSGRYTGGVLSAGYVGNMLRHSNGLYYIATSYSVMVVDPVAKQVVENHLIAFPKGGVNHVVSAAGQIFCSSPDGIRQFEVTDSGKLLHRHTFTDLTDVVTLSAAKNKVYLAIKSKPRTIFVINANDGKVTEYFDGFKKPVQRIVSLLDKHIFTLSDGKIFVNDGKEAVIPERVNRIFPCGADLCAVTAKGLYTIHCDSPYQAASFRDDLKITDSHVTGSSDGMAWHENGGLNFLNISTGNPERKIHHIPIIANEAPVVVVPPFVYSVDRFNRGRQGGKFRLYGFDTRKEQDPADLTFDVDVTWDFKAGQGGFYYDIVQPPFDFLNVDDKYLFAPGALLDVSDPAKPEVLFSGMEPASCIRMNGKRQIFLAQGKKLTILDGTKLPEIKILAELKADKAQIPMWADVIAEGNYLYANGRDRLLIYDIADVTKPQLLSRVDWKDAIVYRMAKIGNYLYLPTYTYRTKETPSMRIVDVSHAAKPQIAKSSSDLPRKSYLGVQAHGGKLYIANDSFVTRYDLSDPLTPKAEKKWTAPDKAMQGYYYMDLRSGILAGKKYPRIDIWRISE